jgi:2-polyprenyl-3-methyl-5-hydroxy-6-metoxy-1,4-benzoquinol methylase
MPAMMDDANQVESYESYYLSTNPPSQENYRKKAKDYHRKFGRLLDDAKPTTILDIGCATGMLTKYLVDRGHRVVGVDHNAQMIEVARRNVQAEFHVADALKYLRQSSSTFDMIFLLDVIEHIPRPRVVELLTALRARLNDNGFVLLRAPNLNCLHAIGMFYVDWTHITPFTERSVEHVAGLAGFSRIEHAPQFRTENFKGKVRAIIRHVLVKFLVWLRGGHGVKVTYRCLLTKLYK